MSGQLVHAMNRGVLRARLFDRDEDYWDLECAVIEALRHFPVRLIAYCFMPNHWHILALPDIHEVLVRFIHRFSTRHAMRLHQVRGTAGTGCLYQGRYRAHVVQPDETHFQRVFRYVESNAARARLVARAEDWRWGSAWQRTQGGTRLMLSPPPFPIPEPYSEFINQPHGEDELASMRDCTRRGTPYGSDSWKESLRLRRRLASEESRVNLTGTVPDSPVPDSPGEGTAPT